jgi:hypothetical protein
MRSVLIVLFVAACGSSGNHHPDAAMAVDARPPDAARPDATPSLGITWDLETANLQGGTNNGFAINCDDPTVNATTLTFSVTNGAAHTVMTMTPCPAGANSGSATLQLPDSTGPFTLSAVIVGDATSASDHLQNVMPGSNPTLRIYAMGCDAPTCM